MGVTTFIAPHLPIFLAAGALIAWAISWWAIIAPRFALGLLALTLVAGQLIRIPLPGQGGGVLLSDISTVLVVLASYVVYLRSKRIKKITKDNLPIAIFLSVSLFILWSFFTLMIHTPSIGVSGSMIAISYWLRLSTNLMLIPSLLILCKDKHIYTFLNKAHLYVIATLVIIGLFQVAVFPNVQDLPHAIRSARWDPHEGRLVSTWLDPNFIGAFLAISIPFVTTQPIKNIKKGILLVLILAALVLTKSRSALVAIILTTAIFTPAIIITSGRYAQHKERLIAYMFSLTLWCVGVLVFALALLGSRATGFWKYDPTVNLRVVSLVAAWKDLAQHNIGIGVGYNAYQFAAQKASLIDGYSIHSRAGADNSFLTLLITTGIVGLTLFLHPWAYLAQRLIRNTTLRMKRASSQISDFQPLAAVAGIVILFIHAQVVNSFLYSHLIITLSVIVALALSNKNSTHEAT